MLGSRSLVVPDWMKQSMVRQSWSQLHEDESIIWVGRFFEAVESNLPAVSGASVQPGLGGGRLKYYPSESARTLLKECFADNPPVQLDPHQQLTGLSSDQMIQFARAVGLEVSLATFGMLEDVFWKIGGKPGRNVGERGSGRSVPRGGSGSTVVDSVASRSFYSLPTITESLDSDQLQQPCSSRQADAVLGFSRTNLMTRTVGRLLGKFVPMCGKKVNCISGHEKVDRTQFRPVGQMVVGMFSPRRCWSSPRLRKFLLLVQKTH